MQPEAWLSGRKLKTGRVKELEERWRKRRGKQREDKRKRMGMREKKRGRKKRWKEEKEQRERGRGTVQSSRTHKKTKMGKAESEKLESNTGP